MTAIQVGTMTETRTVEVDGSVEVAWLPGAKLPRDVPADATATARPVRVMLNDDDEITAFEFVTAEGHVIGRESGGGAEWSNLVALTVPAMQTFVGDLYATDPKQWNLYSDYSLSGRVSLTHKTLYSLSGQWRPEAVVIIDGEAHAVYIVEGQQFRVVDDEWPNEDGLPEDPHALSKTITDLLDGLKSAQGRYAAAIEGQTRDKRIEEADEDLRDALGNFAEVASNLLARALPFVEFHA